MTEPILTAVQQDYLEAIYLLSWGLGRVPAVSHSEIEPEGVRVTDIAAELRTKPPTVVRTLARLKQAGLIEQEERGPVRLTERGALLAAQLTHRHLDVVTLLRDVLGVPLDRAEAEACLIEHGLSGETAQRLHLFLERWQALPPEQRRALTDGRRGSRAQFELLGEALGAGGRQ